jgi:hypothetical protein
MQVEAERVRLTNRHIGKILDKLDELKVAEIIKDSIKNEMWFLSSDLKNLYVAGKKHVGNKE